MLGNPGTGAWLSQQAMNVDMQWADERRTGANMGKAGTISFTLTPDEISEMLKRRAGETEDGEEALDFSSEEAEAEEWANQIIDVENKQENAVNEAAQEGFSFWDFWGPFSTDD